MRSAPILSIISLAVLSFTAGILFFGGNLGGQAKANALPEACDSARYSRQHETGGRERPTVLLLHGISNCPWEMGDLSNALYEEGFHVRSLRLPGHGTRLEDLEQVTQQDLTGFIIQEISRAYQQSDEVYLIGTSFGGLVALYGAQLLPTQVSGVVLLAPYLSTIYDRILQVGCAATEAARSFEQIPGGGVVSLAAEFARFLPNGASAPSSDPSQRYWYTALPSRTICLGYRLALQVRAKLRGESLPTLLITSDDDEVINSPGVREAFRGFGNVRHLWYRAGEGIRHQSAPRNLRIHPRWDGMKDQIVSFVRQSSRF